MAFHASDPHAHDSDETKLSSHSDDHEPEHHTLSRPNRRQSHPTLSLGKATETETEKEGDGFLSSGTCCWTPGSDSIDPGESDIQRQKNTAALLVASD